MRVLVVEDERVLADLVAQGLRREAIAVDVVYDGRAAQERLALHEYDVLVLDRDLPGMHGDDLCAEVADSGSATRVLMLSAARSLEDRVDGLDLPELKVRQTGSHLFIEGCCYGDITVSGNCRIGGVDLRLVSPALL